MLEHRLNDRDVRTLFYLTERFRRGSFRTEFFYLELQILQIRIRDLLLNIIATHTIEYHCLFSK